MKKIPNLPGPKAREVIARDRKVVSPSYPRGYPFVMGRGKGVEVWDVDGNRFLDFSAGIAVVSTGHSHPKVVEAIQKQAEEFIHISSDYYHPVWVQLAEKLTSLAPFEEDAMVFLTNSGTEAVEAAIKLARYHTKRSYFIAFLDSFHGRTMGSLAMTASKPKYRRGFMPLMGNVVHVPFPNAYHPVLATRPGEGYGEAVVRYIEENILGHLLPPDEVAGILIEPIQGEGGYVVPPADFFPALRQLCDRHGILLIADEVQSGMGRTGKWWAIENFGVEPDIVCSAKGIASGVPLGAMIARKSVMTWPHGSHGNTYGGNPLACAASLATIDLLESAYLENAARMGALALEMLRDMQTRHPSIGEVRGIGLMIGVEFVTDRETRQPAVELRNRIEHLAFEYGLLTLGCGTSTIRISPPLSISEAELREGLAIFEHAITLAEQELLQPA
ncbi:MAG: acetyl ornithine aminotransferase family protein [Anaerolineae bacterium]|nr:MAG: acetyl ornithine aminotransferase family protein [Anaerolineae bacterium]